jgi:HlyD family secretion protein
MASSESRLAAASTEGMDRPIERARWSVAAWPLGVKAGIGVIALAVAALVVVKVIAGTGERTLRVPLDEVTLATVEHATFHDLIPLHGVVVPLETVYVDAIDGGRVDRVFAEAGDTVQKGQPLVELSNTNLALQVIQQESQLNQAISQLQQNEIALEQDHLSNERALAEIDYNLTRLQRSAARRESLSAKGMASREELDTVTDELAYYKRLRPIQAASNERQSDLRERLLPSIHEQLNALRENLVVVHDKLASLVIRAPVAGKVTAIDLEVGETPGPGQRLAEVTPQAGMKVRADVDEYYLGRVRVGQGASVTVDGRRLDLTVRRVSPQVRNGQFSVDLEFAGGSAPGLIEGAAVQGQLQLGGDTSALVLPTGAFLERTGADWVFVVDSSGRSAVRRRIKVGRRTSEQLEIVSGLAPGERVIVSDYTGLDRADRLVLTS